MRKLKKYVISKIEEFKVSKDLKESFSYELTRISVRILIPVSYVQIPLSITIIIILLLIIKPIDLYASQAIFMHSLLTTVSIALLILFKKTLSDKVLSLIVKAVFMFILMWTMVFSLLSFSVGGQLTVYLIGLTFVSVSSNLNPFTIIFAFVSTWLIFMGFIPFYTQNEYIIVSNVINLFALNSIAWLTSLILFRMRLEDFMLKEQIQNQLIQLSELNEKLSILSHTDSLTGAYNRRYFDQKLVESFKNSKTDKDYLSIAILDFDDFKQYNDFYGHQAGDVALTQVANTIKTQCLRDTDIFARFGGEEFVIILPKSNQEEAISVCERILKTVLDLKIEHRGSSVHFLTVSIGVRTVEDHDLVNMNDLINDADKALYQAKGEGKNRVCIL